MCKLYVFVFLLVMVTSCNRNATNISEKNVPKAVQNSFHAEYVSVTDVDWEKEGNLYEAEYEENNAEQTILFDAAGTILRTESEVLMSGIPAAIQVYVETNFKGFKMEEAVILKWDGNSFYKIEIDDDRKELDILFDMEGNYVSEDKEDSDENELEKDDD